MKYVLSFSLILMIASCRYMESVYESSPNPAANDLTDMPVDYTGEWRTYYRNGSIATLTTWKNGSLSGPYIEYWPNGVVGLIEHYKDGSSIEHGYYEFHPDGTPSTWINYGAGGEYGVTYGKNWDAGKDGRSDSIPPSPGTNAVQKSPPYKPYRK